MLVYLKEGPPGRPPSHPGADRGALPGSRRSRDTQGRRQVPAKWRPGLQRRGPFIPGDHAPGRKRKGDPPLFHLQSRGDGRSSYLGFAFRGPIAQAFPQLSEWITSGGETHLDWWLYGDPQVLFNASSTAPVPVLFPGGFWMIPVAVASLGALRLQTPA